MIDIDIVADGAGARSVRDFMMSSYTKVRGDGLNASRVEKASAGAPFDPARTIPNSLTQLCLVRGCCAFVFTATAFDCSCFV